ncbi:MAG: thiamine-phosphate pyrophosphorylase [Candidatus Omnitrophica bacterium]|nr:thiamine-phosphate pyrophosphorylase [Candidatus Omnitrophota bacterium]
MNFRGKILRIIDANINRAKEGLRVCEDIMRFALDGKKATSKLKNIRHNISNIVKKSKVKESEIIKNRDSGLDIGKNIKVENSKKVLFDIFIANSQRVKEAIRVLEELFCILDLTTSKKFQDLRFRFYDAEKECLKKIGYLCNSRRANLSQKKHL